MPFCWVSIGTWDLGMHSDTAGFFVWFRAAYISESSLVDDLYVEIIKKEELSGVPRDQQEKKVRTWGSLLKFGLHPQVLHYLHSLLLSSRQLRVQRPLRSISSSLSEPCNAHLSYQLPTVLFSNVFFCFCLSIDFEIDFLFSQCPLLSLQCSPNSSRKSWCHRTHI